MGTQRGTLMAAIVALAASATAHAPSLHVDVHRNGCRFTVRVCGDAVAHGGFARVRVGGRRRVAKPLVAALRALPGSRAVMRGAAFTPAWRGGCSPAAALEAPNARLVVRARTARGPRARLRTRLRCGVDQTPPASGQPPVPAPAPPPVAGPVEPP